MTTTASVIAQGFNPCVAECSPYHGAAYAVIEATARLVAAGANWSKARFSYQEYFCLLYTSLSSVKTLLVKKLLRLSQGLLLGSMAKAMFVCRMQLAWILLKQL